MPVIQLFIDKFQRVVKIDSDHPLAIAQLAKDKAGASPAAEADTHKASAPAANTPPAPPASVTTESTAEPPVIDPARSDEDLLAQFKAEAIDHLYSEEASEKIAAGRLRHLRAGGNGYSVLEAPPEKQESIFDLPPEKREIPAVQKYLEKLSRKELQELAKEHDIAANQASSDLVELLTLTLTTPAPPATG